MPVVLRKIAVTFVAFFAGVAAAFFALLGIVDIDTLGLDSGLPSVAMMTPMLAVVVFWAVARAFRTPIRAAQTFLFGGIAIYFLLYAGGRLVAQGAVSDTIASILGAVILFGLAFIAVTKSKRLS